MLLNSIVNHKYVNSPIMEKLNIKSPGLNNSKYNSPITNKLSSRIISRSCPR